MENLNGHGIPFSTKSHVIRPLLWYHGIQWLGMGPMMGGFLHSQNHTTRQIASAWIHRKTAVWKRLWDSCYDTGSFQPARRPFAGSCVAVVLYTVRSPSVGGHEIAVSWIGMRQAFNTLQDSRLEAAVRRLFPDRYQTVNSSRRCVAVYTIHTVY